MNFLTLLLVGFLINLSSFAQDTASARNKTIAASYILGAVNNKDLSLIKDIYSTEYTFHQMTGVKSQTLKDSSLYSFLKYLFKAFPDLHYTIDNNIAESDIVALNLTGTGTHKGEFLGIKASNKRITFKEMFFFRFANYKIVEGWGIVDLDGIKSLLLK